MQPNEAAEKKVELSGKYNYLSAQLEEILEKKPSEWVLLRATSKSAKEADRLWEASSLGIKEMKLKMEMERIDKEVSALNSYLRVAELIARKMI